MYGRRNRGNGTRSLDQSPGKGWVDIKARPHMCYPPEYYPPNIGPNSRWKCDCGQQWVAIGMVISNYPAAVAGNDVEIRPERWLAPTGSTEGSFNQEQFYDFRSAEKFVIKLLCRMIESVGGEWRDLT